MIKVNPNKRLSANSCLERKYHNDLFKKTYNGHIMGANDTEINTPKDTTSQIKKAEETDNRTKMPTLQSPQWTEIADNTSFLVKNLLGSINSDRAKSMNLLLIIKDFISRAPTRQLMMLTFIKLYWFLTLSLSNLDNSFNLNSESK